LFCRIPEPNIDWNIEKEREKMRKVILLLLIIIVLGCADFSPPSSTANGYSYPSGLEMRVKMLEIEVQSLRSELQTLQIREKWLEKETGHEYPAYYVH